jgi:enoyl-CoA hydratase
MTTNTFNTLRYESSDGVVRITLCRPGLLNRMDLHAHEEFQDALIAIHRDPAARVVLIAGEGKHFSAGGDLGEVDRLRTEATRRRRMFHDARELVHALISIEIPVIAAIQGEATGLGATIAVLCDMQVVAPDSGLTDPHVAIGLAAGDGGCVGWPLAMGLTRAKRYLLTGERIGGELAYQFGLVTDLVKARDEILPAAEKLALKIAGLAPIAVRGTKRALVAYSMRAMGDAFELALAAEEQSMVSDDAREAVAAFMDKRKPAFRGV